MSMVVLLPDMLKPRVMMPLVLIVYLESRKDCLASLAGGEERPSEVEPGLPLATEEDSCLPPAAEEDGALPVILARGAALPHGVE